MFRSIIASILLSASAATACDLALLLAVDVSGSVDRKEFRVQMEGLATALRDGTVADALLDQNAHLTLVQWTGSSRQRQTLPWTAMENHGDVVAFAQAIEADTRVWRNFSTAIGEALAIGVEAFDEVPQCTRRVIDVSGDGKSNEGVTPRSKHSYLRQRNVTVNGLAIETDSFDLTAYFFENLITGEGAFVETAWGFEDYPAAILRKLQRETARVTARTLRRSGPVPVRFP